MQHRFVILHAQAGQGIEVTADEINITDQTLTILTDGREVGKLSMQHIAGYIDVTAIYLPSYGRPFSVHQEGKTTH